MAPRKSDNSLLYLAGAGALAAGAYFMLSGSSRPSGTTKPPGTKPATDAAVEAIKTAKEDGVPGVDSGTVDMVTILKQRGLGDVAISELLDFVNTQNVEPAKKQVLDHELDIAKRLYTQVDKELSYSPLVGGIDALLTDDVVRASNDSWLMTIAGYWNSARDAIAKGGNAAADAIGEMLGIPPSPDSVQGKALVSLLEKALSAAEGAPGSSMEWGQQFSIFMASTRVVSTKISALRSAGLMPGNPIGSGSLAVAIDTGQKLSYAAWKSKDSQGSGAAVISDLEYFSGALNDLESAAVAADQGQLLNDTLTALDAAIAAARVLAA